MNQLHKKLTCFKFISKEIQVFVKFKNNLQCGFLIGICFKDILNIRDLKNKMQHKQHYYTLHYTNKTKIKINKTAGAMLSK